jgi:two-component sensor histidine kinase
MSQVIAIEAARHSRPDLVKEANHRIANQLAALAGMVQSQIMVVMRGATPLPRETAVEILRETASKVISVAHLHRRLASLPPGGPIPVGDLLVSNIREIASSLSLERRLCVRQILGADCLVSGEQAQLLSFMIGEIILNALKHAHPTGIPVEMSITCAPSGSGAIMLEICDDGVGLPEGFDTVRDGGTGFGLIRSLARALQATLQIESDELGLCFHLVFPTDC